MPPVDDEIVSNPSDNPLFADVVAAAVARRTVLIGGLAAAAATFLGGGAVATAGPSAPPRGPRSLLGFAGIAISAADAVVVPPGYTARPFISWGDPLSDGPAFKPDASCSAADQEQQWGMHNDAVWFFPFPRNAHRALLVQNHEYTDDVLLFPDGTANWSEEKTAKSLAAHGVSVIELRWRRGTWEIKRPSRLARRITGATPITIGGPAAGHELLRTSADPTGTEVLGIPEQLRLRPHAAEDLPRLRGELQRLLPQDRGAERARSALRHQRDRVRLPLAHDARFAVPVGERAQRAQPVRLGHRDRPVRPAFDAGQAHRAGPLQARGVMGRRDPRQAHSRVLRRRRAQRVRAARSPVSSSRPTSAPCSSAFSTRARHLTLRSDLG